MEKENTINNDFYEQLGDSWNSACDHPIALLRAENRARLPWIEKKLSQFLQPGSKILDIACGGGFTTNPLAQKGYQVTGIDLSAKSLKVAKLADITQSVNYLIADAYKLPFSDSAFDAVLMMDFLEHIEEPERAIKEASRVLKKDGLFFFHTFNRNLLSYIIIIKGVEWFVKNVPKNMHIYSLFLKPEEVKNSCYSNNLLLKEFYGLKPRFSLSFIKLLLTKKVDDKFNFNFTSSLLTSYGGYFVKF